MKISKLYLLSIILIISNSMLAQVAISIDGSIADESAMLDVNSDNKGLLIPQIALTSEYDATTISTPTTSLLVFNTTTNNGLTAGYYFNSGTATAPVWKRLVTGIIDGSETLITAGTNIEVTGDGTSATPYEVSATAHYIGESYGGGVVFYVYDGGQHGLIAATSDLSTGICWYNGSYVTTCARRNGINAGNLNTESIINNQGVGDYAAQICSDYQVGLFIDWYLPSQYELNLLYAQKDEVGGFSSDWYWSSTEVFNPTYGWAKHFGGGWLDDRYKSHTLYVRAIRAF